MEAEYNTRHEIANDYQIADADTETFDRDSRVKQDRGIGVCDLAEREKARRASLEIARTSRLQI